jgi:hypothetical protein
MEKGLFSNEKPTFTDGKIVGRGSQEEPDFENGLDSSKRRRGQTAAFHCLGLKQHRKFGDGM